jgi:hypothetical protein
VSSSDPRPTTRRHRWLVRREERFGTLWRILLVLVAVGLVVGGWRLVTNLLAAPQEQLVATCAGGPYSHGTITAAGGPEAAADDETALRPYTRAPALTTRWFGYLRDAASRAGDRDLARTALSAERAQPGDLPLDHLATIEQRCATYLTEAGVDPSPREWFRVEE